jgi:glutathione synthase/RimK-type ligase-like ATP-grasp enzyme
MKTPLKSIVFIVRGKLSGESLIKYATDKDRQFQEAYREIIARFAAEGMTVFFALPDDYNDDVEFTRLWSLEDTPGENGALVFKQMTPEPDFTPSLVINKIKDDLYDKPAYQAFLKKGVKVLNPRDTAQLGDKHRSLECLGEFLPATTALEATDSEERRTIIEQFIVEHGTTVLKPYRSNGGRGLVKADSIDAADLQAVISDDEPYILQQFIETGSGVGGFVSGRHDVRLYIVGGEIIAASTRQPAGESWMSNTSQGGSIHFSTLEEIPAELTVFAGTILDRVELPRLSFISFDFFFSGKRWYLIEANDQPGTPASYQHEMVASSIQNALVIICKEALA